ncbi:MAG TPA: AmmeMemoRadiSam system protein A [Candidatus Aquicultoraceae bacterium]|nr:AmmeMemoRadiSam system protein A [Candidatus Aquicultoraceae bacterium]
MTGGTAEREGSLTAEEREELIGIARRAAASGVRGERMPERPPRQGKLTLPGAAFVTIRRGRDLRGCIGYTESSAPLYRSVQDCAVAAATRDPRFPRVTPEELGDVRIEISVLTPLVPVRPEEVTVGVHGLMIRKGDRQGLLLPRVAVDEGWDRLRFLAGVCEKARLPTDAWKEGADLYSFTAEVFGE